MSLAGRGFTVLRPHLSVLEAFSGWDPGVPHPGQARSLPFPAAVCSDMAAIVLSLLLFLGLELGGPGTLPGIRAQLLRYGLSRELP